MVGRQANPWGRTSANGGGEKEGGRGGEGRDTLPRPTEGREAGGRRNLFKTISTGDRGESRMR